MAEYKVLLKGTRKVLEIDACSMNDLVDKLHSKRVKRVKEVWVKCGRIEI